MQVHGYERSWLATFLTYLSFVVTVGIVRLFFHWYPHLYLYATHKKCPLERATKLLIIDDYQGKYKSYFVKKIKIVSTKNFSVKSLRSILDSVDEDLLEKIRGKWMDINLENGTRCQVPEYRAFWCKKQCYVWDVTQNVFSRLVGFDKYRICSELHMGNGQGLTKQEQLLRRIVYGNNEIVIPVQDVLLLLVLEFLNPFYIFQIFTLCVWLAEGYYYYTAAIICMSLFGTASSVIQTRKNQMKLRETVACSQSETVRVLRDSGTFENISSKDLVPGDIIELPKHQGTVACDAVLLTGTCIVNESMLTGESVPVMKTPLSSQHILYDPKNCSHHTLFSGTIIIQTRQYGGKPVLARVIRTGLQTSRGALVAAILYPPPADFKFDQDSYKFIGILAFIATLGFIYTVVTKASRGITASDIAIKALDIITIVIPPALPAAMTVGKLYAQARLKCAQIYCINNRVINVSGSINCVCFDKTGTLTEDGLDMWGIVPNTNGILSQAEREIPKLKNHPLFEGMLVCHSLTIIDGKLCGDPLDVKMFESTEWIFEEIDQKHFNKYNDLITAIVKLPPGNNPTENRNEISEIGIIQQFQFSSSLQRMSVIVHSSNFDSFKVYTKGSPEMILSLSKPESIPEDIIYALKRYTEQGYRVIAMAQSTIQCDYSEVRKLSRDVVEQNLEFLGLIVLENRLKEPTIPVIAELRKAEMHVLMITGDNIQTAVSVAKECGILSPQETVIDVTVILEREKARPALFFNTQDISPRLSMKNKKFSASIVQDLEKGMPQLTKYRFALTGTTWQLLREYYPDILPKICVRGAIFARMGSDQKQQLVVELMQLGYYVVMCGDGANDCGALRAAHAGVSLSEAESSVASPFTSRVPDITCVPKVIREGRAALVTSFGIFKFMVTYSLTEFLSVIILYSIDSNLTDLEFLFIDICLIVNFASFFGKTKAFQGKLTPEPPMTSLLSFVPLFSLTTQMMIMLVFQTLPYHLVRTFSWFKPFTSTSEIGYTCYENYSVYCVSMFQYITMAIVFSRGKPYRQTIYTNKAFLFSIILLVIISAYITVYPAQWIIDLLQLMLPPANDWRILILVFAFANFVICMFVENFIIEYWFEKKLKSRFYRPEKSKKQYLRIEHELKHDQIWPKLSLELPVLHVTPSVESMSKVAYTSDKNYAQNRENDEKSRNAKHNYCGADNPAFEPDDAIQTNVNIITRF
ncbi:polyamine-transporting ATPase 13A3-like isoform X2 [Prorops nasuta]